MNSLAPSAPNIYKFYVGLVLRSSPHIAKIFDWDTTSEVNPSNSEQIRPKFDVPNERTSTILPQKIFRGNSFGYVARNYLPYDNLSWKGTAEQIDEMITYKAGLLVMLH